METFNVDSFPSAKEIKDLIYKSEQEKENKQFEIVISEIKKIIVENANSPKPKSKMHYYTREYISKHNLERILDILKTKGFEVTYQESEVHDWTHSLSIEI